MHHDNHGLMQQLIIIITNLSKMRTRRAIVRSGNTSVAVMFHAWERKFALSVDG